MRIPNASDTLGNRVPQAAPMTALQSVETAGQAVNQGMQQAAQGLFNIGMVDLKKQKEEQDKLNAMLEHKVLSELKARENAEKQNSVLRYETALNDKYASIMSDNNIPMLDKYKAFSAEAQTIHTEHKQAMGPEGYVIDHAGFQANMQFKRNYTEHLTKWNQQNIQASTLATLEGLQRTATQSPEKMNEVAAKINAMNQEATGFDPVAWQKQKQVFSETVAQTSVLQSINAVDKSRPGVAFKQFDALHKQILAKDENGAYIMLPDLDPKVRQSLASTVWTQAVAMKRDAVAEARHGEAKAMGEFNLQYGLIQNALQNGEDVSPESLLQLKKMAGAGGLKTPLLMQKIDEMVTKHTSADFIIKKQQADPFWGTNAPKAQPGDFQDPQKFGALVQQWVKIGADQRAKLGLDYNPAIPGPVAKQLAAYIERNPQYLGHIALINQHAGKEAAQMVAAQIAALKPEVGTAVAKAATGDYQTAIDILKGNKYLNSKQYEMNEGKTSEISTRINDEIGPMFAGNQSEYKRVKESIKSLYANYASKKGYNDPKAIDSESLDKAISSVIGPTVKTGRTWGMGGVKTPLPPGYTVDRWNESLNLLTEDAINKNWGGVKGMDTTVFLNKLKSGSIRLVPIGTGAYQVMNGDSPVFTGNNKPFTIGFTY